MKISLVMIVKNEERSLEECLRRAIPLVDEIVIADTGSTDRTKAIAQAMGARIYDYGWTDDFSAARNFALDHSTGEWNLVLDGDEYLRPCTRTLFEQAVMRNVQRFGDRWMGAVTRFDVYPDGEEESMSVTSIPRLLPAGVRYTGIIHEQPDTDAACYRLPLEADHDGYLRGDKGERNLPYLQEAVKRWPDDLYYKFQLAATLRNLKHYRESLEWFRDFYGGFCVNRKQGGMGRTEGLRPGLHGNGPGAEGAYLTEGLLLYLYTLLDVGDKQCLEEAGEVIGREEPAFGHRSDFCFVCGLFYMKLVLSDVERYVPLLPKIEASYLKCLKIGECPGQDGVVGTGSFKAAYNLGLWYEVSGQREKAEYYYGQSDKAGYGPAAKRLKFLRK